MASRDAGRLVAVRLTDVPLKIRRRYGAQLHAEAVEARDLVLAAALNAAVEHPTGAQVHWLPEKAVRKVLG
jgi:hypothetical protein